jgi:HK97 gp10 family phage protein
MTEPLRTTYQLKGFKELGDQLKQLNEQMQRKTIYRATLAAAGVVRNEARRLYRQNWNIRTGALDRNIAAARGAREPGRAEYVVGVRAGRKAKGTVKTYQRRGLSVKVSYANDPYYWWFLENGAPGANIPARPFLRPALDTKREQAIERMRTTIQKSLLKAGLKP